MAGPGATCFRIDLIARPARVLYDAPWRVPLDGIECIADGGALSTNQTLLWLDPSSPSPVRARAPHERCTRRGIVDVSGLARDIGCEAAEIGAVTHACAVAGGQLYCGGREAPYRRIPTPKPVTDVAGHPSTMCVSDVQGHISCWGYRADGTHSELGELRPRKRFARYAEHPPERLPGIVDARDWVVSPAGAVCFVNGRGRAGCAPHRSLGGPGSPLGTAWSERDGFVSLPVEGARQIVVSEPVLCITTDHELVCFQDGTATRRTLEALAEVK